MTDTWTNDLVVVLTRVKDLLLMLLMLSFSGELQQRLNTDSINEAKKKLTSTEARLHWETEQLVVLEARVLHDDWRKCMKH